MRSTRSPRAALVAAIAAAACLTAARDARADFDFQLALGVTGGWLRRTPTLQTNPFFTSSRGDSDGGRVPMRGGVFFLGPSGDASLTLDDRWTVPLIGGVLHFPVGSYDAVATSVDGSVAEVRPWTAFRGDLLLPGLGRRFKHRRFMWAATLRTGVTWTTMDGSVAAGAGSVPLELFRASFLLQAEIEACRRLDPTTRVCLQIVPRIYEHELLNGLSAGVRMEWGR